LLILTLPLARHRILFHRPPFSIYHEFTSIVLYLSDFAAILLLLASAMWFWREKPFVDSSTPAGHRWGPAAISLPLALLPALALATVPRAGDPGLAGYVAYRLVVLLAMYVTIVALRPSPQVVQLSLAASLMLQVTIAVAQFVTQDDLGWRRLGEVDLDPTSGWASVIVVGSRPWLRGYGLTPHPNILGGILVATLLALVIPYLESHGWRRIAWLVILAWGGVGLVISFSRAAWLGGAAGGAILLVSVLFHQPWRQRYARAILVPALVGLVGLAGFTLLRRDLILARLTPSASPTESRSLDERRILADMSVELIRRSPLAGVGAGNFTTAVAPLIQDVPDTTPQPVHNLPLLLSAELGLAGGVLWLWLMLAPWVVAWQRFRNERLSLWALGLTAGLVALAIIDLFDFYSWGWSQGRLLRWIYLGLWSSAVSG
jgi:O-antigen ligase